MERIFVITDPDGDIACCTPNRAYVDQICGANEDWNWDEYQLVVTDADARTFFREPEEQEEQEATDEVLPFGECVGCGAQTIRRNDDDEPYCLNCQGGANPAEEEEEDQS
jgi:hypothetical protein